MLDVQRHLESVCATWQRVDQKQNLHELEKTSKVKRITNLNKTDFWGFGVLGCCCFEREEVRHCAVQICALWNLRPYQDKTKQEDSDED